MRAGLALLLAIPAALVLGLVVSIVMCGMIGPWGGALDGVDPEDVPPPNRILSAMFSALMVAGPLILGWVWAGRVITWQRRTADNLGTDADPPISIE